MKTRIAVVLIGLLMAFGSFAQPHRLENYRHLLAEKEKIKGFEQDTAYIHLLAKFSTCFYEINPDSLLFYAQKTYKYAENIHDEKGALESFCSMGYFYSLTGDYTQMLYWYQRAQLLAEKINDKEVELNMLRNIGQFYLNTGKEAEALDHFKKAYKMAGDMGNPVAKAYVLVDMAGIDWLRHDYDHALGLYREALQVINDPDGFVAAFVRTDIGSALCEKKQYREAVPYFRVSLDYYRRTGDKLGSMNTMNALANACRGLQQTDTAIFYAATSLSLAKELKNKEGIMNAAECLADLYEKKGDYRQGLTHYKLFKVFSDSLFNEDTRKKTAELQAKFVYEKKEVLLKEAQANRVRVLHFEVAIALVSALLLGIIIVFFLYPRWLQQFPRFREVPPKEEYKEESLTYL